MSALASDAARRLRSNPAAVVALFTMLAIVALALLGPWLNPNTIEALDWLHVAVHPGLQSAHWFGTDRLGRDLFVRTLAGTRVSLGVGLVASVVSLVVGLSYGAIAGYNGGRIDHLMMRVIEILSGLPLIFFVIVLTVDIRPQRISFVLLDRRSGLADHGAHRARTDLEHSQTGIHRSGDGLRSRPRPHHRQARDTQCDRAGYRVCHIDASRKSFCSKAS